MADKTLGSAGAGRNPPHGFSESTIRPYVDSRTESAEARPGAVVAPAGSDLAAPFSETGSCEMSRRQALSVAMVPTAIALGTIEQLVPSDPGPGLWRKWRAAAATWSEPQHQLDLTTIALKNAVSEIEVDGHPIRDLSDVRRLQSRDLVNGASRGYAEYNSLCARLVLRDEEVKRREEAAGIPQMESEVAALWDAFMAAEREILEHKSPSPASIAAKLHIVLDHQCFEDPDTPEYLSTTGILRDLLPCLPEDMATAIAAHLDQVNRWMEKAKSANPVRDRDA